MWPKKNAGFGPGGYGSCLFRRMSHAQTAKTTAATTGAARVGSRKRYIERNERELVMKECSVLKDKRKYQVSEILKW